MTTTKVKYNTCMWCGWSQKEAKAMPGPCYTAIDGDKFQHEWTYFPHYRQWSIVAREQNVKIRDSL